ncbi:hypothetical protein F5Y12DRAFT_800614 [Xylaria sp. FL1777]|nr:hypothetical protein F5Y12DRAFT_800614 [Xylaria sp. FL1777]
MQALGGSKNDYTSHKLQNPYPPDRKRKRIPSPKRWETRQLITSSVAKALDFPDLDDDHTTTENGQNELGRSLMLSLGMGEPPFLGDQITQSLALSPIQVQQEASAEAATNQKEREALSAQWNGRIANFEGRRFASDIKNTTKADNTTQSASLPKWKRAVQPKIKSYGRITNMTIKQQRKSLRDLPSETP